MLKGLVVIPKIDSIGITAGDASSVQYNH